MVRLNAAQNKHFSIDFVCSLWWDSFMRNQDFK